MTASTFLLCSLLLPMPPEAVEMHYLSRWRVLRWLPILRSFLGGCGAVCAWRSDAAGLQERRAAQVHSQARSFSICAILRTSPCDSVILHTWTLPSIHFGQRFSFV